MKGTTLKIEPELTAQAAALFAELGMDLSTATGIFYRQALRYRGLPFDVRLDEPNKTTYAAIIFTSRKMAKTDHCAFQFGSTVRPRSRA